MKKGGGCFIVDILWSEDLKIPELVIGISEVYKLPKRPVDKNRMIRRCYILESRRMEKCIMVISNGQCGFVLCAIYYLLGRSE